jgi:hypothetical protein
MPLMVDPGQDRLLKDIVNMNRKFQDFATS